MEIPAYPKIYNLGRKETEGIFNREVIVEEKVDGSQISFMCTAAGELLIRSKSTSINTEKPEGMFGLAVEVIKGLSLSHGAIYRGEYLRKPKHNALSYSRYPVQHIVIFDIQWKDGAFFPHDRMWDEATRLGLEIVPVLAYGSSLTEQDLVTVLNRESFLRGPQIEGVVIKPIGRTFLDPYGHPIMGKYVSEKYREIQKVEWKGANPSSRDIIDALSRAVGTEARWAKAVQHLQEAGRITDDPRDIGPLIAEVQRDIEEEALDIIEKKVVEWALPKVKRGAVRGLAEWYKKQLFHSVFASEEDKDERSSENGG